MGTLTPSPAIRGREVLRHLRTGQGSPLEELGLQKAADELQHWRPDIPGAGAEPGQT